MMLEPCPQGYEEYYIAFIDILGFSDLVKRSEEDCELLQKIVMLLNAIKLLETSSTELPEEKPMHYVHSFSDSIIIFTKLDEYLLFWLLYVVGRLCAELLMYEIVTRGSIVKGKLYYDNSILFGRGLIEAYELESKVAKYPRILVSDEVYRCAQKARGLRPLESATYMGEILRRDLDECYHLNYLSLLPVWGPEKEPTVLLIKARAIIIYKLKEYKRASKQTLYEKYVWFANYFNAVTKNYDFAEFDVKLIPKELYCDDV